MAKRLTVIVLAFSLLSTIFVLREWLLLNEIQSTQALIKMQINDQLDRASSLDRVQELSTSAVVFERYLEPVLLLSNKLTWPGFRNETMASWKRIVHTKVDQIAEEKEELFTANFNDEVDRIRNGRHARSKRPVR